MKPQTVVTSLYNYHKMFYCKGNYVTFVASEVFRIYLVVDYLYEKYQDKKMRLTIPIYNEIIEKEQEYVFKTLDKINETILLNKPFDVKRIHKTCIFQTDDGYLEPKPKTNRTAIGRTIQKIRPVFISGKSDLVGTSGGKCKWKTVIWLNDLGLMLGKMLKQKKEDYNGFYSQVIEFF